MLRIEPVRWFSWDFTVDHDGRTVAALDISWWRDRGDLVIAGDTYRVSREGLLSGSFRLSRPSGVVVAEAEKPSVLRRRFIVRAHGRTLTLQARSTWGRTMDVLEGGRVVGTITPNSAWTRRGRADLPDTLPAPVQVFLVWLSLLLWKRDEDSAAASG